MYQNNTNSYIDNSQLSIYLHIDVQEKRADKMLEIVEHRDVRNEILIHQSPVGFPLGCTWKGTWSIIKEYPWKLLR